MGDNLEFKHLLPAKILATKWGKSLRWLQVQVQRGKLTGRHLGRTLLLDERELGRLISHPEKRTK